MLGKEFFWRVSEILTILSIKYFLFPQDAQWNDIDYMTGYRDFTFDPKNFASLPQLVADLHSHGQQYVMILVILGTQYPCEIYGFVKGPQCICTGKLSPSKGQHLQARPAFVDVFKLTLRGRWRVSAFPLTKELP